MSEPPVLPPLYCSRCGTMNPSHATTCWLCVGNDRSANDELPQLLPATSLTQGSAIQNSQSRVQTLCAALLIVCIVLTILIGIGLAVQDPGTLIAYSIFVGPAYLATGVRALYGMSHKDQPKASTLLLTFLFSAVFTTMAVVLLVIASVIAFFVWCLSQL